MDASSSSSTNRSLPVVAILGRPNVGKSTLFNRLIRKRRSITDPTPGVTRDLIEETAVIGSKVVRLVDSGGVTLRSEGFDDLVTGKSYEALRNADLILLMFEAGEITPEDEELIERSRPFSDRVRVVVNKVDHDTHENLLGEFYRYGYDRVFPISAEHGRGIGELVREIERSVGDAGSKAVPEAPSAFNIAVMGKPNTGKSTLVNQLLGTEVSVTSHIPGTTRDVVSGVFSWKGSQYRILDTAGIRRKKNVGENVEYYSVNRAIKAIDEADVVLLLIDAQQGLSDQDKKIASLVTRKGKGIILVFNKWDLMEQVPNLLRAVRDRLKFVFPILAFAPMLPVSAKDKTGLEALMKQVSTVCTQLNRRIGTAEFNDALNRWMTVNEPSRDSRGRFKIFYGTQTQANPVEFVLFVNRKQRFPKEYIGYLTNSIRKDLGFTSVPVKVELRERARKG